MYVFSDDLLDIASEMNDEASMTGCESALRDDDVDDDISDQLELPDSDVTSVLFVHPMITIRHHGRMLKSLPANSLPTCFRELRECFDDISGEIDLNDLRVTFDLICLTLPPETDLSESDHRPCYTRMTSYASQLSYASSLSDNEEVASNTMTREAE